MTKPAPEWEYKLNVDGKVIAEFVRNLGFDPARVTDVTANPFEVAVTTFAGGINENGELKQTVHTIHVNQVWK